MTAFSSYSSTLISFMCEPYHYHRMMSLTLTYIRRAKLAMNDPEIQQILQDPSMQVILEQMQKDPAAAQE